VQTLDRGLRVLELLAAERDPLTVNELAAKLELERTIVYRLVRTLVEHHLVTRDRGGRYSPGLGLLALARRVATELQIVALPELTHLAEEVGATALVAVADGDEVVTLVGVEPQRTPFHVAVRVGFRARIDTGATGIAILAGRPPQPGERPEVSLARARGYAVSHGELHRGMSGVAAPIRIQDRPAEATVCVVTLGDFDETAVAPRVIQAAHAIATALA
jgi:DNA-binding IclR family transcriptional regulator